MTSTTPETGTRRDHGCQTPGCPNDFAVITLRVDDGEASYLCEGCHLAFSLAVLQQLGAQGLLAAPGAAAAGTPAQPPPAVL